MRSKSLQIAPARLQRLAERLLRGAGSGSEEAEVVAANLVKSNLVGHDSHGIGYLPEYIRTAVAGRLVPNQKPLIVTDAGPIIVLDGQRGYGQVMGREAMLRGIDRAKDLGACIVSLRNSHHLGRIGAWASMATDAGLASIHMVNVAGHTPLVSPFGGADARLGTNPFTAAFPSSGADGASDAEPPPVTLDMATSKIALGKARNAFFAGEALDPGLVIDSQGYDTTDPGVMFPGDSAIRDGSLARGALKPLGDHKGFGLGLVCEIFGAIATGGTLHLALPLTPRLSPLRSLPSCFFPPPLSPIPLSFLRLPRSLTR